MLAGGRRRIARMPDPMYRTGNTFRSREGDTAWLKVDILRIWYLVPMRCRRDGGEETVRHDGGQKINGVPKRG